jgi:hypothetical protein
MTGAHNSKISLAGSTLHPPIRSEPETSAPVDLSIYIASDSVVGYRDYKEGRSRRRIRWQLR